MSVINQMLKDLEKQEQVTAPVATNSPVSLSSESQFSRPVIALSVAIISIAVSSGFMFWKKHTDGEQAVVANVQLLQKLQVEKQQVAEQLQPVVTTTHIIAKPKTEQVSVQVDTDIVEVITAPIAIIPEEKAVALNADLPVLESTVNSQAAKLVEPPTDSLESQVVIKQVKRTPAQQATLYQQQAEDAFFTGDSEKAKQRFQQVLTLQADNNSSREQLAAILFGEKRTKSAVNLLQQGLSVSPEYANFRLMLARIYMKNNDKKQAYYYLKPYQPEVIGNLDYYALLAGLAQNLADLDVALMAYSKLTEVDPNRAKWWLGLGITADKLQRSAFALDSYKTAQAMGQLSAASRKYIDARIALLEK